MNKLELVYSKPANARYFSMSPLHARIKFMECLLKVAYDSQLHPHPTAVPLWGKQLTPEHAALKKRTKEAIQLEFEKRFGLHVDKVRRKFGNSNDGNTPMRFFADCAATAEILNSDKELISRFGTILDTINCNGGIDEAKFEKYSRDTAK